MMSVTVELLSIPLSQQPSRILGEVVFLMIPIEDARDVKLYPRGLLSIEEAKRIANRLVRNETAGSVAGMIWQMRTPDQVAGLT
jgi:hypothetical protein